MRFSDEHHDLRRTVKTFIEREVDPHVEEWERAGVFPAHELFKKLGKLGLLGLCKPEAVGGMGLDYSFSMVMAEELGLCRTGAFPGDIGADRHGHARPGALRRARAPGGVPRAGHRRR